MLIIFSVVQELENSIIKLARERLTKKQKQILYYLHKNKEKINATNLVSKLSEELNCSKSTGWNNLNSLKRSSFLSFSSRENKGVPVELTKIGKIIIKSFGG